MVDGGYDDEYFSDDESGPQSKRRKTDGEVGTIQNLYFMAQNSTMRSRDFSELLRSQTKETPVEKKEVRVATKSFYSYI